MYKIIKLKIYLFILSTSKTDTALSLRGVPCHFSRSSILGKPLPLNVLAKMAVGFSLVIEASWKA